MSVTVAKTAGFCFGVRRASRCLSGRRFLSGFGLCSEATGRAPVFGSAPGFESPPGFRFAADRGAAFGFGPLCGWARCRLFSGFQFE